MPKFTSGASDRIESSGYHAVTKSKELASSLDDLREETQRLESIYQQKLAALEELKKSLLHQAFSGGIVNHPGAQRATPPESGGEFFESGGKFF